MDEKLKVISATKSDAERVFKLSNDDEVRRNSINTEKIEWHSHLEWFSKAIESSDCAYFIAEYDGEFCGQIRFNLENGEWVTSISVANSFRGRHIGSAILKSAISKLPSKRIIAYAKSRNAASLKMFSSCGFSVRSELLIDGEPYKLLKYGK